MEMRKQGSEGQATARSASKSSGKKQPGEQARSSEQSNSPNETKNENTGGGNMSANQGAAAQRTGASQGAAPSGQGASGQQQQGQEQDLLQHAKDATGEIVNQVQQRAGSQFSRQKETAAAELSQVANAVRRIRESLKEEETGAIGRYAAEYGDKAADTIERFSNYIRQQDPKQLLHDVQSFGRRRPALMVGGAFLLGFAGARLIKSSIEAASQSQSSYTNNQRSNTQGSNVSRTNVSRPGQSTAPNAM